MNDRDPRNPSERRPVARRQFLRGAGGFALAVPLLPSLLSRRAEAAAVAAPKFVCIVTGHGGTFDANFLPPDAVATETKNASPGHPIRYGTLKRSLRGDEAFVSPVLRAPATALTDRMVSKLSVIRGLDVPFDISHNNGSHLGNFFDIKDPRSGLTDAAAFYPTIDQLLAWSPAFYPDLSGIRERAMLFHGRFSWGYSQPSTSSGPIQAISGNPDPLSVFDRVFGASGTPGAPTGTTPGRQPIVDKVLDNYKSLRDGGKLSGVDQQRLGAYMDRLSELERTLTQRAPIACGSQTRPTAIPDSDPDDTKRAHQINDIVAAAFACGASRIAVIEAPLMIPFHGDWHQEVAHHWQNELAQDYLVYSYKSIFQHQMLDLAAKLDAIDEGNGKTALDSSLLYWSQECCMVTHLSIDLQTVLMGGANGFFTTGRYIDYRNLSSTATKVSAGINTGLPKQRLLANILLAMGLRREQFERNNATGYGQWYVQPDWAKRYPTLSDIERSNSDPLPVLASS